ncbi:ATP phosphoribosyltransferase regulatory subunit [Hyphomonas sp.]|uniref:ATP phosphoribosyltransferase regulatory subunit n=1 Tax=Hyphomonas sp. TaxID=87 RepID=UPI0032ED8A17|tara:strand:- start:25966 stop:27096 length:1131 start_codon:yes stop_codon:yes gene_type:complete
MTPEQIVEAASAVFARTGARLVDPAYVLASDIPLELSGEAVRARLCVFTDHRGNEMVMRPDLTLPVAGLEAERLSSGKNGPEAYTYAARAFRLPASSDDSMEFTQVGFERFGRASTPCEDADAFALVQAAVAACGIDDWRMVMGDLAVFPAFVDALGLARVTTDLLKRAFRQEGGVAELLAGAPSAPEVDLAHALSQAAPDEAGELFLDALRDRSIPMIGTRSVGEIIEGLVAKAAAADAGGVPGDARRALGALASVNCAAPETALELSGIAREHGLAVMDPVIERVARRVDAIIGAVPQLGERGRFRSGFGRRFAYYDGFVFETFAGALTERQPIATGGRYDGLIAGLSAGRAKATGIGGVVRPDRVVRARGRRS